MKLSLRAIVIISIIGALIIFSALLAWQPRESPSNESAVLSLPKIPSHPMFFDSDNFQKAIGSAEKIRASRDIRAIVVPQHLLASSLIARQLKSASGRDIDTVFIIGPNHFNIGTSDIASAKAVWETVLGDEICDENLVDKFLTDLHLLDGPEIFYEEHAIGAIVPFVKYYFPRAKIVPIVFRSYADQDDVRLVSDWLSQNIHKKSLVIYSIDFSHYLPREQADQMDAKTREYINSNNIEQIMTLGDDNLDSPASLGLALQLAQEQGWEMKIVDNKNSDDFTSSKSMQTTSYFLINFSD